MLPPPFAQRRLRPTLEVLAWQTSQTVGPRVGCASGRVHVVWESAATWLPPHTYRRRQPFSGAFGIWPSARISAPRASALQWPYQPTTPGDTRLRRGSSSVRTSAPQTTSDELPDPCLGAVLYRWRLNVYGRLLALCHGTGADGCSQAGHTQAVWVGREGRRGPSRLPSNVGHRASHDPSANLTRGRPWWRWLFI